MSRDNVRGLMVFQPHAPLIVLGEKQLETRDWAPGPDSGTPEGWKGTLLIVSGAQSPWHDNWFLRALAISEIFRLVDPFALTEQKEGRAGQGDSLLSNSCILGAVDLVGVSKISRVDGDTRARKVFLNGSFSLELSAQEAALGIYEPDRYVWKLENPRRLPTLIPFEGRRRLFEVPEEILLQIEAQGVTL